MMKPPRCRGGLGKDHHRCFLICGFLKAPLRTEERSIAEMVSPTRYPAKYEAEFRDLGLPWVASSYPRRKSVFAAASSEPFLARIAMTVAPSLSVYWVFQWVGSIPPTANVGGVCSYHASAVPSSPPNSVTHFPDVAYL